ncbi:MAG TPA: lipoyl synthase [Acidimicrobiales bacterium]|jgi:lipoic acid synthetase|nr:lipoyl synthase [Acidimicrobiales bacterium]
MLRIRSIGTVSYAEANDLQHSLAAGSADDYLLLLHHPHVYTLGSNADPSHMLVDPTSVGATMEHTDRGGDITYHGPGQLVAYPIISVPDDPAAGPAHVHFLEELVIATLTDLGLIGASADASFPGVWIEADGPNPRKIAAIGVRTIRNEHGRRRTLHGVALNVECDLAMFGHIVPCGIVGRGVTSTRAEGLDLSMADVREAFVARAVAVFRYGEVDRQSVMTGVTTNSASTERPLIRRLRQAGVEPDTGLQIQQRKPEWLRVPVRLGKEYSSLGKTIHDLGLVTVCEEAGCPNIFECWSEGTATFMINGERCTRACGFCQVDTRHPLPLAPDEPDRVARAVARMELAHAVVTCVARDDLPDGGAGAMAETIHAIRARRPDTKVEVLISDCRGVAASQQTIFDAGPDILNHNIESVARLQRAVRPSAGYARSLTVLARAAKAGLVTKSGLMVGLGEVESEVISTMADLRAVGVSIITIGQYLRPSRDHLPIARYWSPQEFDRLKEIGADLGVPHVEASPLTRSSYHARDAATAASAARQ